MTADHISLGVDLKLGEEFYRSLFENMLNGFAYCRMLYEEEKPVDFMYLDVNEAFRSLTGLKDVVGRKVTEVIPGIKDTDPQLIETYNRVATSGKSEQFEVYLEALKMWLYVSVYCPQQEHFVAVFDVITERKQMEESLRKSEEQFRTLFEQSQDAVLITTPDGCIFSANQAACNMFGMTEQEICKAGRAGLVDSNDPRLALAVEERNQKGYVNTELTCIHKNGDRFPAEVSSVITSKVPPHSFVIIRDISERKQAEKKVSEQAELLNLTNDAIIVHTMDNVITFWNKGAELQYGWKAQDIEGKFTTHDLLQTKFPIPFDEINDILLQTNRWEGDLVHSKRDGSQIIVSSRWVLKRDAHCTPVEILEINNDITKRKMHEEQLQHISTHDVLTGLYNRTYYEAELDRLTTSRRYPVSVIIIDLDDLKHTNDTYGHAAGDKMICKAANILMNAFRAEDMVARSGGDEFVILLPETDADGVNAALERIQRSLEEANKLADGYEVKFSVGTAIAESKEKMLGAVKVADSRMYQNKAKRKMLFSEL